MGSERVAGETPAMRNERRHTISSSAMSSEQVAGETPAMRCRIMRRTAAMQAQRSSSLMSKCLAAARSLKYSRFETYQLLRAEWPQLTKARRVAYQQKSPAQESEGPLTDHAHGYRKSSFEEHVQQQLIPGISNDTTLEHIVCKLSWQELHSLPEVSRGWLQAIQSRQVHNARVKFNSTETLVIANHRAGRKNVMALYSTRSRCFYFLPPIPHFKGGFPEFCQCVSLDGKVYLVGLNPRNGTNSQDTFVLDLVGRKQWRLCARMQVPRLGSACGVVDGKIYAFGGYSMHMDRGPVRVSEVYDPKADSWSLIMPMLSLPWNPDVVAVGEELYAYGGQPHEANLSAWNYRKFISFIRDELFLDVYNPVRDEWRKLDSFERNTQAKLFVAGENLYSMTEAVIFVHDSEEVLFQGVIKVHDREKGSWTHLHSFSIPLRARLQAGPFPVRLLAVIAVDNELLLIVNCAECANWHFRSSGFISGNQLIFWSDIKCSLRFGDQPFMCLVQL